MRLAPAAATASRSGLTSSLLHASQASAVLCCALIILICALPVFSQSDDLASMTADELYQKADTLYKAGNAADARPIYQYIVEHHADNVERAAWALYRLCSISYSERDIDTALAYIQRAVDDYPTSGIATRGYATSYLTAIYLVYKKDYQAGVDIGEKDLEQFGAGDEGGRVHALILPEAPSALQPVLRTAPGTQEAPPQFQALFSRQFAKFRPIDQIL